MFNSSHSTVFPVTAVNTNFPPNIAQSTKSIAFRSGYSAQRVDTQLGVNTTSDKSAEEESCTSKSTETYSTSAGDEQSSLTGVSSDNSGVESKRGNKSDRFIHTVARTMSGIDKAAERRRKNRESSSRCYYNRKRIIEGLDRQVSEAKTKLTTLYDRALELRHENARLKKDVVTRGIALPTKTRTTSGVDAGTFSMQGYMQLMQNGPIQSRQ